MLRSFAYVLAIAVLFNQAAWHGPDVTRQRRQLVPEPDGGEHWGSSALSDEAPLAMMADERRGLNLCISTERRNERRQGPRVFTHAGY